jgi:hypothetical protein
VSRANTKTKRRKAADTPLVAAADTVSRFGEGLRSQVDDLDIPGKLDELDLAARLKDARRELADRIDPAPAPKRRRRLLRFGLLTALVGAVAWVVLARRPEELDPLPTTATPPVAPPSVPPAETTSSNGSAPSSTSSGTRR